MAYRERKRAAPAKFYQEDIVQRISNAEAYGVVMRCWHDAEDVPPSADNPDPLMRPLQHGEVGVSFFPSGVREIMPESALRLVDRMFQPGDFCKRSVDDVQSGVVKGIDVKGRLVHSISGAEVPGWKTMADVEGAGEVDIGDYVACDDWIGQVIEMFDESLVEVAGGQLVRLPELSARFAVGDKGNDILPSPNGMFSMFMPKPSDVDTIVSVSHVIIAVAWLAINQSLDPATALTRSRPQRLFHGSDMSRLRLVRGKAEQMMRVGDRVQLKDPTGFPSTRHGNEKDPNGVVEVRTFTVKETDTSVHVLWQDGTQETVRAAELIPYLTIDEYDVWPGDPVIWKTEDGIRSAVIQSVNAADRTAHVRLADSAQTELVSLLELDAHGTTAGPGDAPGATFDSLGVRRGDFVFIHGDGSTNGSDKGRVPRIGELPGWARELGPQNADGSYGGGWRGDLTTLGLEMAQSRGRPATKEEGQIKKTEKGDTSFNWLAEVSDLRLDGTVEVTYPDSTTGVVPLERLTRLHDGLEQLEEVWEIDGQSEYTDEGDEVMEVADENGHWTPYEGVDEGDWEEVDDDEEEYSAMEADSTRDWAEEEESGGHDSAVLPTPLDSRADTPMAPPENVTAAAAASSSRPQSPDADAAEEGAGKSPWKRFEILGSAPPDHAYITTIPGQPSRQFMTRLQKEYRVLSTSLPDSIIVRAYEDRADLLRSLIFGPENTPYEDAPFMIDWMLPSDFPQSPPVAHFHSWTNGNGRVNPNLYEEGKVCLSILGTWAGDRNETWSAARSSLMQAFVSIQGLVLVKEPWYCEPAYEKLRGTEEGIVNSRLYSEKAYVLSRNFVRRALEVPLGGLEQEVNWMYYENGKLRKVLQKARALVEASRVPVPAVDDADGDTTAGAGASTAMTGEDSDVAVPRLTAGGIIMLERTLHKLQGILDAHQSHGPDA